MSYLIWNDRYTLILCVVWFVQATLKRDLVNAGFAVRVLDPPAIAEDQVIELFDVDM